MAMGTAALIHSIKRLKHVIDWYEWDEMKHCLDKPYAWATKERAIEEVEEVESELEAFQEELEDVLEELKRFLANDMQIIKGGLK